MKNVGALILGLLVFLIPAALLAWSTLTERGRKTYERSVAESEMWPKMGGLIPLRPPQTAATRLAYSHPWSAGALVGIVEAGIVYMVSRFALDRGQSDAIADGLWFGVEGFVILGLIFRAFSKQYGTRTAGN